MCDNVCVSVAESHDVTCSRRREERKEAVSFSRVLKCMLSSLTFECVVLQAAWDGGSWLAGDVTLAQST